MCGFSELTTQPEREALAAAGTPNAIGARCRTVTAAQRSVRVCARACARMRAKHF